MVSKTILLMILVITIGTDLVTSNAIEKEANLCDNLLTQLIIWPCKCDRKYPTELKCQGPMVTDYSLNKLERDLKYLSPKSKLKQKILEQFRQLRVTKTNLTKFDGQGFKAFAFKDVVFDSNKLLKYISTKAFRNGMIFDNFQIRNMQDVTIDE